MRTLFYISAALRAHGIKVSYVAENQFEQGLIAQCAWLHFLKRTLQLAWPISGHFIART